MVKWIGAHSTMQTKACDLCIEGSGVQTKYKQLPLTIRIKPIAPFFKL